MSELPDNKDNNLRPNKLSAELRLLARAIEAFKENAIVQREQIAAQEEHIKHDREVQILEKKLNRRTNFAIALITLVGVIATVFVGLYVSSKENEIQRQFQMEQELQVQAREHGQELEANIRDEIAARDRINSAITEIRYVREANLLNCKDGKFIGNSNEYEKSYLNTTYKAINAWFSLSGVFDSDIIKEAQKILFLVNAHKNVCEKNSLSVMDLQLAQRQLNLHINKVISDNKEKRNSLLNREKKIIKEPSDSSKI